MNSLIAVKGFDAKYGIINSGTPSYNALSGRYKKSFAYYTLRERYPVILTDIIDELNRYRDEIIELHNAEETKIEIDELVCHITKLKHQLQTDKRFEKFCGKEPDKELWNDFIQHLPLDFRTFFRGSWLYAECYLYRKVSSFFENTATLKNYDYFAKGKQNSLKVEGVLGVAKIIRETEKDFKTFDKLIKLNLWGNKCDLSIVLPKEFKPKENIFEQLDSLNDNILINNTKQIWQCLESADPSKPIIVEFICDNAGFELYTDFVIADYLIGKKLASKVRFSVKAIPWYISDVIPGDITWSLDYLEKHESSAVQYLATKWKQYFQNGNFEISPVHYFWVSPYEYYKMREIASDLYQYLAEAHLIIFKGDLNYRKLLGDMSWDPTDEFITCIRGFRPTNFCALRTIKADLVCGLPQGKAEELHRLNSQWMVSGEYGLIQFMEQRLCECNMKSLQE